jgi:hypothetical protein
MMRLIPSCIEKGNFEPNLPDEPLAKIKKIPYTPIKQALSIKTREAMLTVVSHR